MDKNIEPATDDAELAKVLDSMNNNNSGGLSFEETPVPGVPVSDDASSSDPAGSADSTAPSSEAPADESLLPTPSVTPGSPSETPDVTESLPMPSEASPPMPAHDQPASATPTGDPMLESIKQDAITQLRPLVDKLNLPSDEKFDTLLLLIRSTDDQSLVSAAFDAAKQIPDDAKRAQALLDVIKEIDFFSQQK